MGPSYTSGRQFGLEFAFYVALGGCGRYSSWKVDMPHDFCQGRLMVVALENQVGSTR